MLELKLKGVIMLIPVWFIETTEALSLLLQYLVEQHFGGCCEVREDKRGHQSIQPLYSI